MTTPDNAADAPPPRKARSKNTRPDSPGMKRASIYCSEASYKRFEEAVEQVHQAIGDDTPRHVAVSALLEAAAGQADDVTRKLARQHAEELARRLKALEQRTDNREQA